MAGESVVSSRVVPKSGLEIPDGCTLRAWKISLYDRNLGQQYRTTLPEREYHSYKCARQSAATSRRTSRNTYAHHFVRLRTYFARKVIENFEFAQVPGWRVLVSDDQSAHCPQQRALARL